MKREGKIDKYSNLIFFTNGSIGDFLMVLYFMQNVYASNKNSNLIVATPRGLKLFKQLSSGYPYVRVEEVGGGSLSQLLKTVIFVLKNIYRTNLVITPPTFGTLPLRTKVVARLTSFSPKSKLIGFQDKSPMTGVFYNKPRVFNTDIFYFEMIQQLLQDLGYKVVYKTPTLSCEGELPSVLRGKKYVVLHPFGAVPRRSILENRLLEFIRFILSLDDNLYVVITGSKNDKKDIEDVSKGLTDERLFFVCGDLSMYELCSLFKSAILYIGVDTGPTHIANFLGVRSLVIAHEGTPNWLPYYNKNARILYEVDGCTHQKNEGKDHLQSCREKRVFLLKRVPDSVVKKAIKEELYGK